MADKNQLVERVKRHLATGVNPPVVWNDHDMGIWLALDLANAELAREVAGDPERAYILQRNFAVAATSNYVDLASVDADYELLADTIQTVYDPVYREQYHLAHNLFDLMGWVPPGFRFYAIENGKLYLRPANTLWDDAGSVLNGQSVQFNCIARPVSFTNLDDRLIEDLVLKTVEILLKKPISTTPNT